jgi:hypothetical protein
MDFIGTNVAYAVYTYITYVKTRFLSPINFSYM